MMTEYKLTKEAVKTLQRVITPKATIEVERLKKLVKICLPPHYEVRDNNNDSANCKPDALRGKVCFDK